MNSQGRPRHRHRRVTFQLGMHCNKNNNDNKSKQQQATLRYMSKCGKWHQVGENVMKLLLLLIRLLNDCYNLIRNYIVQTYLVYFILILAYVILNYY